MADELPLDQRAAYSAIIDDILAGADLNTISAKRVKNSLQEQVDVDLRPQKAAIKALIIERFDKAQTAAEPTPPVPAPTRNGHADSASPSPSPPTKKRKAASDSDEDDLSSVVDSPPPKKVKKKAAVKSEAVSDEALAAKLQAEFNQQSGRATRGGGAKKKSAAKPTKTKKKSKTKISAEDDSEVESGTEKPEKEKKGGFHKLMNLSEPLAAMLGEPALSRPQTVKKIWEYVRARDLQDPSDKRQIRCDDAMHAVFKQDKVHMFTMNKLLSAHYYPREEE